jgi:flagellar basal-body rod protein FlgF
MTGAVLAPLLHFQSAKRKRSYGVIDEMSYAVQGAFRQEIRFDVLSNNLANVGTSGFKAQTLSFDDMLQAHMNIDFSQGSLVPTGNPLDLGLNGDGFFKIQTDQGVRYTRNGSFSLDKNGMLVTSSGDPVLGENGPITIDGSDIQVSETGEVLVDGSQAAQLSIVTLAYPEKFSIQGESLFAYSGPATDEKPLENSSIQQGSVEQSNVATVLEMTKMVETSRFYESYQKLMQSIDEMDAKAINEVGPVR